MSGMIKLAFLFCRKKYLKKCFFLLDKGKMYVIINS